MLQRIEKEAFWRFSFFFVFWGNFFRINWMLNGKLSIIETGTPKIHFTCFFLLWFPLINCFHLIEQNPAVPAHFQSEKFIENISTRTTFCEKRDHSVFKKWLTENWGSSDKLSLIYCRFSWKCFSIGCGEFQKIRHFFFFAVFCSAIWIDVASIFLFEREFKV